MNISMNIAASPASDIGDFLAGGAKKAGEAFAGTWDKTAGKVGDVISFAEDPLKAIFQATRDGAEGLATELLPALSKATEPDLSADFFIKAYAISFAVSIMVWGVLLIFQFLAVASGKQAGADFVDTVFMRSMVFFVGALFGPWVGVFLVKFFGSMSTSLIDWGVGSSSDKMLESMNSMLEVQPSAIPGGVIVGILLMICMILGFLLVVVMLAIMLVTLYLTGVVLPLGLVWFASGKHDAMAKKIPVLWLCLLASHPLLFFLMGFSFNMIAEAADWMKWSGGLETLMGLVAAVVAMAIAGMSPILLMKFAPVMPSGSGQQSGPSMSAPEKSYGAQSLPEAKEEMRTSKPGTDDAGQDEGESAGGGGAKGGGGLMNKLKELGGGGRPEEAEAAPSGGGSGKIPTGLADADAGGGARGLVPKPGPARPCPSLLVQEPALVPVLGKLPESEPVPEVLVLVLVQPLAGLVQPKEWLLLVLPRPGQARGPWSASRRCWLPGRWPQPRRRPRSARKSARRPPEWVRPEPATPPGTCAMTKSQGISNGHAIHWWRVRTPFGVQRYPHQTTDHRIHRHRPGGGFRGHVPWLARPGARCGVGHRGVLHDRRHR